MTAFFLRLGLLLSLIFIGCGSLVRTLNPKPAAPGTLIFLATALLGGMSLPWLALVDRWLPTGVQLQRDRVVQTCGNTARHLPYAACRDYGISDSGAYQLLVVGSDGGQNLWLGVPPAVDLGAVGVFLEQQRLRRLSLAEARERLPEPWHLASGPNGFVA